MGSIASDGVAVTPGIPEVVVPIIGIVTPMISEKVVAVFGGIETGWANIEKPPGLAFGNRRSLIIAGIDGVGEVLGQAGFDLESIALKLLHRDAVGEGSGTSNGFCPPVVIQLFCSFQLLGPGKLKEVVAHCILGQGHRLVEAASAGEGEVILEDDVAARVGESELWLDRFRKVKGFLFEFANDPLEVDRFARPIEGTVGEKMGEAAVFGLLLPAEVDGKAPHRNGG